MKKKKENFRNLLLVVIISSAYSNGQYKEHLHTNSVAGACRLNFITEF